MAGPLDGIRVVDLSQVISGPWATMLLADQGAEVIKVEPVEKGEVIRILPNFTRGGINALIANSNRGKLGLAVDLTDERGAALLHRVLATADVLVENFRPGAAERLGFGSAQLRERYPRLVTCSITGFGPDGPWANRPVYDPIIQAMTGHAAVQENPALPFRDLVRTAIVDKATSLMAAQAITAALLVRERNGEGQQIDISMLDASMAFFWPDGAMAYTMLEDVPVGPTLYETYKLTQCSDGHIVYWVATIPDFVRLGRALGRPDLMDDPRWSTPEQRRIPENLGALGEAIDDVFRTMSVEDAVAALQEHDVPGGPVLDIEEVFAHEQVVHNDRIVEFEHPTAGRIRQVLPAADFSTTKNEVSFTVPVLGADTDAVLRAAGCTEAELADLREAGVIG